MKDKSDMGLACVGGVAIFIAVIILMPLIDGFVLMKVWNWVVPKVFVQLPYLTFFQSIGVSLVASILTAKNSFTKQEDDENQKKLTIATVILFQPAFFLLIGWIISLLI